MGASHTQSLLYSMGVPLFPSGMPILGDVYWVDPAGLLPVGVGINGTVFTDIVEAYDKTVDGQGDVVFLVGGMTAASATAQTARIEETLVWAKNHTHLRGICAPTDISQRARISTLASGTYAPLLSITGSDCIFSNFSIFDNNTVDPVAVKVSGQRNYFGNVAMQGMGIAAGAADAAAASLWLAGGAENLFEGCSIGLDTIARSAANAEIRCTAAATRNSFRDCRILSYCSAATHLFVDCSTSGSIDRYLEFIRCRFINYPTGIASGLTMTQGVNLHASAGGMLIGDMCTMFGATDVAAADNGNVLWTNPAAAAGTAGLAVAVTR